MPVAPPNTERREKAAAYPLSFSALVARSVPRREVEENPDAKKSVLKEWDKLRAAGCWDEGSVREWSDVADEARRTGSKAHVGRIFEICVEKGSELPVGDPNRKYKGRVVFQGNNVKDENWQAALFNEMSSAPASMEASKACDAFGLLPGHATQQCDAEQAYIQSKLEGAPTWVRMPRERWPAAWAKFRDPVCPLKLALYGHPDAGGCWEKHCEDRLRSVGFVAIADWRSCFWHEKLSLFLTVYVDDFKMSGPAGRLAAGWETRADRGPAAHREVPGLRPQGLSRPTGQRGPGSPVPAHFAAPGR